MSTRHFECVECGREIEDSNLKAERVAYPCYGCDDVTTFERVD